MKKIVLTAAVALLTFACVAPSSQAYESRRRDEVRNRRDDRETEFRQLRAELYSLDILFARVESRMRYGIRSQSRWQYSRLLRDRERLNFELQRRPLNRPYIHAQIDRLRDELREIEVRLRFSHRHAW